MQEEKDVAAATAMEVSVLALHGGHCVWWWGHERMTFKEQEDKVIPATIYHVNYVCCHQENSLAMLDHLQLQKQSSRMLLGVKVVVCFAPARIVGIGNIMQFVCLAIAICKQQLQHAEEVNWLRP